MPGDIDTPLVQRSMVMKIKRIFCSMVATGAALYLATVPVNAAPFATPSSLAAVAGSVTSVPVLQVQYYGPYYGPRYYGRPRVGAGVAAGVAAGVLGGALAAGALAPPVYAAPPVYGYPVYGAPAPVYAEGGGSVEYCARRYRSYNAATGTYIGRDGATYYCP
jgi:hypothetical protein